MSESGSLTKELGGSDTPSAGFIFKWLGIMLGAAVALIVIIGSLLPREWGVELSVEIEGEPEAIHALVSNVEQWPRWMFDPDDTSLTMQTQGQGVGASVSWTGEGSRGEMSLVESAPETGIAWDGKIESDEVNNHGSIRYEIVEPGRVRVTLVDEGTLPPIVGGFFVPVMNSGLHQHFTAALDRLELAVEGASSAHSPTQP